MMMAKKLQNKRQYLWRSLLAATCVCCWPGAALAADADTSIEEYSLADAVVTAERIPTAKMDTPANITVITAQKIADNHYSDVAEALRQVNGVTVSTQAMGSQALVRLNGDDRVVVLVDGVRLNNDQGITGRAGADLNMLPSTKNIERIEVVKGGASALYGSDAVGGVINIITKKGQQRQTTLDLNTGSWGTHNYELATAGSDGTLSWFITGGLQKRGYFSFKQGGSNERMPASDYNNNSFSLRLDDRLDDSSSVQFDFSHKSVDAGAYRYNINRFIASDPQTELFNNLALTYHFKANQSVPGFVRYFDNYKSANFSGHFNTRLYGVDYQNGWQIGSANRLVAGVEWHESKSSNLGTAGYGDREITNQAVYLQDTMKLADKWSFVPGVRVDHHNMFGTHWTPKAAVNYNADNKTQLYASWGRVYKAPTADDLYYKCDYGSWGTYYGNPSLQPETGYTISMGLNHKFNKDTSLQFNVFQSELHDAIDWYNLPGSLDWRVRNMAQEKKHGLELSFQQQLTTAWSYDLAYSYIHTETTDDSTYYSSGNSIMLLNNSNQPNGYRFGVHYHKGAWKANLLFRMGSGLNTNYYARRSYAILDFNTAYDINKQLEVYFKVNNLTNQDYSDYVGWKYPAAGRFFQIGMTYSF